MVTLKNKISDVKKLIKYEKSEKEFKCFSKELMLMICHLYFELLKDDRFLTYGIAKRHKVYNVKKTSRGEKLRLPYIRVFAEYIGVNDCVLRSNIYRYHKKYEKSFKINHLMYPFAF